MSLTRDPLGRVRGPWVALVFAIVAFGVGLLLKAVVAIAGLFAYRDLDSPLVLLSTLPTLLAGVAATLLCWVAFRESTGLVDASKALRFGGGFLLGGAALVIACVVPALVGATSLHLSGRGGGALLGAGLMQLFTLAPAGVGEELLLRGLGFQALRRSLGDVAAVAVTSVVFGALHLFNPGSSWLAVLEVALVGAWFGAITVRTGSVWTSMGLHVAWNFFEGFVFGQPVSGNPPGTSLFVAGRQADPSFWSGGAFGPEAAGWTAVVLAAALLLTLAWPRRSAVLT